MPPKKKALVLESFSKSVNTPTHPRVLVRFGNTKGEIRVKKGEFRGFGNQPPHPPIKGKVKKDKDDNYYNSNTGTEGAAVVIAQPHLKNGTSCRKLCNLRRRR